VSERIVTHPFMPVPYWRNDAMPYERQQVKDYPDGGKGVVVCEAPTPDGPWTECRFATVQDIETHYPKDT
jgi:hypothetical protein